MCLKKCFMFCVVLVLALGSVMAWPVTLKKPTTIVETINGKATESEVILNEISTNSTNSSESTVTPEVVAVVVDEDIVELETKKKLSGDELEEFKVKYADLKNDVNALIRQNDELVADNTKLLKEKKSKFFADLGLAFGFEDKALMYGFAGDIGMRFGSSFMGKIGATYMFGSFADIKNIGWNIDKLTVSATVGWEW